MRASPPASLTAVKDGAPRNRNNGDMEPSTGARDDRPLLQRSRRLAHLGVLIAIVAVAMVAWRAHPGPSARASDIMLLYVGAYDCAPCRAWQKGDGANFLASPEFPRIRYREVKSPRLADVLKDDNWPEELRIYRRHLRPGDGVPLWLVVGSDHEIVERKSGASAWRESILPRIRSLLGPAPIQAGAESRTRSGPISLGLTGHPPRVLIRSQATSPQS